MMKKILIGLGAVLSMALIVVAVVILMQPQQINGNIYFYNTVTVQLAENTFYNIRVPAEAQLLSTDGATVYQYDLLTVGVQDTEPSTICKVKVADRWVFATSEENWFKPTLQGFEEESPYSVSYDWDEIKWEDELPPLVVKMESEAYTALQAGDSYLFGGDEFITTQTTYGTFSDVVNRALLKMVGLYKQTPTYGLVTDNIFWVTCNDYTVAVKFINYNTHLLITAHGEEGKQCAVALLEGVK